MSPPAHLWLRRARRVTWAPGGGSARPVTQPALGHREGTAARGFVSWILRACSCASEPVPAGAWGPARLSWAVPRCLPAPALRSGATPGRLGLRLRAGSYQVIRRGVCAPGVGFEALYFRELPFPCLDLQPLAGCCVPGWGVAGGFLHRRGGASVFSLRGLFPLALGHAPCLSPSRGVFPQNDVSSVSESSPPAGFGTFRFSGSSRTGNQAQ